MRWLPTAAAILILSTSSVTCTTSAANKQHNKRASSTAISTLPAGRRKLAATHKLPSEVHVKNLAIINDRFEEIARATHSALNNLPLSNDDPDFQQQMEATSIYIDGTRLTRSPTDAPQLPLTPAIIESPTYVPTTLIPTPSPSYSPSTLIPTAEPSSSQPTTDDPTTSSPTSQSPTTVEPSTSQPTTASPTTARPSPSPTFQPVEEDDSHGTGTNNDDVEEEEDACAILTISRKCKKNEECEWDGSSCTSINTVVGTVYPTYSPSTTDSYWPTYSPSTSTQVLTVSDTAVTSVASTTSDTANGGANDEEDDETIYPTYSPTSTKSPSSNSTNVSVCPQEFNQSLEYKEGDTVSMKRSRCRSLRCHTAYQCKPWPDSAYCSLIAPGNTNSDKGWLKLGRCYDGDESGNHTSLNDEDDSESPIGGGNIGGGSDGDSDTTLSTPPPLSEAIMDLLTSNPTASSTTSSPHQDSGSPNHEDPDDSNHQPSPSPTPLITWYPTTKDQSEQSPSWVKPPTTDVENVDGHEGNTIHPDDAIRVELPRIIADITLSSSLSEKFEQKHLLLEAMTNMIYDLFGTHLPPSLYDLAGISLSVEVKKNKDDNNTEEPTLRIHAYFNGEALFTLRGAPTRSDLITLLVRYFDVDEFNRRLVAPPKDRVLLKTRAGDTGSVKVNSVFFMLEDGTMVSAGSVAYQENKLPTSVTSLGQNDNQRMQVAFVLSALIGELVSNMI